MTEMERFLDICNDVIPERVSVLTNYGEWNDRIVMKGPNLKVSVVGKNDDSDQFIKISDERGLSFELPCEGVEIVEVQNTNWDFESHIYFFTFEGFARLNIIGRKHVVLQNELKQ
ncbi:hypothetical protein [Bacillus marinisedimentorum]|uniref:hypothetical protein n=1 Tax=Bacillus marinisedimentorum TaxID=1821260 RepID=UPI000871ED34|nr:hypothetical protein [Bacillus marinisedimentorum]